MEIAATRQLLADEISKLSLVISKKTTIPILETIKVETQGQSLRMVATDMESFICSTLTSNLLAVIQEGTMCLPAKRLSEIVRLLPDGPIKITTADNGWLTILAKGSRFKVPTDDYKKYPEMPSTENITWVDLPAKQLKAMMTGVKYAITPEESRLNLRGAQLEVQGSQARIVTTDGSRLSLATCDLPAVAIDDIGVMVPVEGVDLVLKLAPDTGDIGVSVGENHLFFRIGNRIVITRLLTGKFPSYQKPFASLGSFPINVNFKADHLAQSIRRGLLSANKATQGVSLEFTNSQLKISSSDADLGEAYETLASDFQGEDFTTNFNGKFMLDFLEPVGSGVVKLELNGDKKSPVYFIGQDEGVSFYYVLMPLA